MRDKVYMALDGSPGSRIALEWSLLLDGLGDLVPICVYEVSKFFRVAGVKNLYNLGDTYREEAQAAIAEMLGGNQELIDRIELIRSPNVGSSLVEASRDGNLLVLGSRGRSSLKEVFLGSVASYCAKRAVIPTAVVPASADISAGPERILVGTDCSEPSRRALLWTAKRFPHGDVTVIRSYHLIDYDFEGWSVPPGLHDRIVEETREFIEGLANEAPASRDFKVKVEHGDPRLVLRDSSYHVLVLAAHGRSMLPFQDLGSTTNSLIHNPVVPTVVVP